MNRKFPQTRMRRNRSDLWLRELLQEHRLHTSDLILPLFVTEGSKKKESIKSLPDIYRLSIDNILKEISEAAMVGIKAIALFPVVPQKLKTSSAKESYNSKNLICRTIKEVKKHFPNIGIIADVALDPYNKDGHDGIVKNGKILNDKTLEILAKQSLTLAKAGADIIAPSDMMDGRVGYIRNYLDQNDFENVKILSYAVKYASSFYGPFRDAVGSATNLKQQSKESYQMSFHNQHEAITEAAMDIDEGADIIMVKPAIPYLDVIRTLKNKFKINIFAYHVSGEYAALKAAAQKNYLDYDAVIYESLTSCKRAGATAIFCYDAINVAKIIRRKDEIS